MGDSIDSIKQLLRSVLLSSKTGVKANRLQGDYQELCGGYIPHTKFGFSSLHDFIVSINDVVRVGRNSDNELTYYAVADSSTQHIQALVSKQKSTKAKPKKKAPPSSSRNKFSSKPNFKPSFYRSWSKQPTKKKYSSFPTKKSSTLNHVSNKENLKSSSYNDKYSVKKSTSNQVTKNSKPKDSEHVKKPASTNFKNTDEPRGFAKPKKPDSTNSKKLGSSPGRPNSRQNSSKTRKGITDNRREFNKQLPPRFAKKVLASVLSEISVYKNPLHATPEEEEGFKHDADVSLSPSSFADGAGNHFDEFNEDNWNSNLAPSPDVEVSQAEEEFLLTDLILDNLKKLLSIYECGLHLSGVSSLYKETFGQELPASVVEEISNGDIPGYVSVEKVNIPGNKKCILFPYVDRQSFNEKPPEAVSIDVHYALSIAKEHEVVVTFSPFCDKVYVQLMEEADLKEEMLSLIKKAYFETPVSRMLKTGGYVITDDFFRAKVVSISKKQIEIYRIDHEDCTASYWTSMEKVRPMTSLIASYPEFCILCKMHRPSHNASTKWSPESAVEFSDAYANSPLVLNTLAVSSISSIDTSASQYEHTVMFYKITENYKCNINVRLSEEECAILEERTKHTDPFQFQPSTYAALPEEEVCVLCVLKASCTTEVAVCIIGKGFSDQLANLEIEMFDFYSTVSQDFNLPSPLPCDCVYAVLAEKEDTCLRGKLLSVNEDQGTVYLVDNGVTEVVPLQSLYPLQEQFADLPMQSIFVSLARLDHEPLSTHCSILQKLNDTVLHKSCPARIVARCGNPKKGTHHVVELYSPEESDIVSVNEMCFEALIDDALIPTLPSEGGVTAVSVSNVEVDKSLVFVRLAGEGMVKLKACLSALESTFDSEKILPSQQVNALYPGKLCLIFQSNGLARVRIQKIDENQSTVTVYMVDLGIHDKVPVSSLLKLDDETALTIPSQAICCKLSSEIYDANYCSLAEVAKNLHTLPVLMRVNCLYGNEEPDLVTMWINDPTQGLQIVAHEGSSDDVVSVRNLSASGDAQVPRKSDFLPSDDFKSLRNPSPHSIESLSTSSSMSDLKHHRSPISSGSGDAAVAILNESRSSLMTAMQYDFKWLDHLTDFMYTKTKLDDYKEVLSLEENPFLVRIEDVVSPDYLQLISFEKLPGRDLLTTALTNFYEVQQTEYEAKSVTVGESYAMCASNESCWYRVRILNLMDDKISVYMYDYGECRVTSKLCLRVLDPYFRKIEQLIITAKLAGIQPLKQDNDLWPASLSKKLSNIIKGKCYFAHVLKIVRSDALLKRDVWEVCLCDTSTTQDHWINDMLVDEWRCATYID